MALGLDNIKVRNKQKNRWKRITKGKDRINKKWKGMCHTQKSDKLSEESLQRYGNI